MTTLTNYRQRIDQLQAQLDRQAREAREVHLMMGEPAFTHAVALGDRLEELREQIAETANEIVGVAYEAIEAPRDSR